MLNLLTVSTALGYHTRPRPSKWLSGWRGCLCFLALTSVLGARSTELRFREHVIEAGLKFGYQLAAADLNGDGKIDLIAVDERATELAWYENPSWQRHVIAADVPRTINVDCADMDGDGAVEIAILYRFESRPEKSLGMVSLLTRDGDPRRPWKEKEIDRVPTAHRVRWAWPSGGRRPVLVMAPMVGLAAEPPEYQAPVPMYVYRPGEWKRELISDRLRGVLHSIYPVDWDGDGSQELLTASFIGLRLFRLGPEGAWTSSPIAQGAPQPCPKCGSSEVALGRLGQRRFLAAIEPWHGDQLAVYRERRDLWLRKVIDDTFQNGHALAVGDLDRDGRDEVVAGYRGKGFQLYYYRALDTTGERWQRYTLDAGGIAAADCKIRDLNADGRPDVVCIGASTANIKWYENLAP